MPPETEAAETIDTAPAATHGAAPAAAPAEAPATGAAAPPSLFDAASPDAPKLDAEGQPIRPDWLPEQFWDPETKAPRADALAKSWADLRRIVSRGEHKPPADDTGYSLPAVEGLPADFVPVDDAVWTQVRKAAHQAGLTAQQLQAVAAPMLAHAAKVAAEAGAPPPPEDPAAAAEAQRAAYQAEIQKLGPNGERVLRDVDAWMKGLASRGILTEAELGDLRGISTAAGVRALAKLRELAGERALPVDALMVEDTTQADAQRMMEEGFAKNDAALVEKGRQVLRRLEREGRLAAR
jgi:hypothetical protein